MKEFVSKNRTDDQYYEAMSMAYKWYKEGENPSYSTGICGSDTAGYGKLDEYGYWEYPLNVVQDGTLSIGEES